MDAWVNMFPKRIGPQMRTEPPAEVAKGEDAECKGQYEALIHRLPQFATCELHSAIDF